MGAVIYGELVLVSDQIASAESHCIDSGARVDGAAPGTGAGDYVRWQASTRAYCDSIGRRLH
ncbi:hypothetical protein C484_01500 [Natrialba taiwanensis DSM 12281]|uniref:Uncharacterized protein n=1 Tax=Natrialba taiwanensis DSM 12281 TaxID=1230458 RepID=M0AG65_9EURY|nr:hypothetical protein C484_01500 [Natrialba taiwanensis DSM 12281]